MVVVLCGHAPVNNSPSHGGSLVQAPGMSVNEPLDGASLQSSGRPQSSRLLSWGSGYHGTDRSHLHCVPPEYFTCRVHDHNTVFALSCYVADWLFVCLFVCFLSSTDNQNRNLHQFSWWPGSWKEQDWRIVEGVWGKAMLGIWALKISSKCEYISQGALCSPRSLSYGQGAPFSRSCQPPFSAMPVGLWNQNSSWSEWRLSMASKPFSSHQWPSGYSFDEC